MWQQRAFRFGPTVAAGRVTRQLIILNVAVFIVEALIWPRVPVSPLMRIFGLSRADLFAGMLWQPVTYQFLHGGFLHLFGNMLGLYFFGREMEARFGPRRFLQLYLGCGILGGLGWLLITGNPQAVCIGASGSVFGIIAAFAALYPHRQITLLVFYVLPVTLSARMLALIFAVISLVMLRSSGGGVAHAAHLGGGLAGYLYGLREGGKPMPWRSARSGLSNWRAMCRRARFQVMSEREPGPVDWQEVDRVLKKVRAHGIGSLSRAERAVLDQASRGKGDA